MKWENRKYNNNVEWSSIKSNQMVRKLYDSQGETIFWRITMKD